jgi:hypothetical protein
MSIYQPEKPSFENYLPGTESQKDALDIMRRVADFTLRYYTNGEETAPVAIYLSGEPGVGKKHLLQATDTFLQSHNVEAAYWRYHIQPVFEARFPKKIHIVENLKTNMLIDNFNEAIVKYFYPRGNLVIISSITALDGLKKAIKAEGDSKQAVICFDEMISRGENIHIIGPSDEQKRTIPKLIVPSKD